MADTIAGCALWRTPIALLPSQLCCHHCCCCHCLRPHPCHCLRRCCRCCSCMLRCIPVAPAVNRVSWQVHGPAAAAAAVVTSTAVTADAIHAATSGHGLRSNHAIALAASCCLRPSIAVLARCCCCCRCLPYRSPHPAATSPTPASHVSSKPCTAHYP